MLAQRSRRLVPFEELDRWFGEVSRRFEEFFSRRCLSPFERLLPSFPELRAPFEGRMPRVDMVDREAEIVVRVELPGVTKEDLDVSMTDDSVTFGRALGVSRKKRAGNTFAAS